MPQRYILWLQSASIVPAKEKFAFFCLAALLEWLAMIGMQAIRMVINMLQHQRWINLKFKFVSKGFASKALVRCHVYRWAPGTLQYSSIFKVNFKVQKGWVCDYLRTSAIYGCLDFKRRWFSSKRKSRAFRVPKGDSLEDAHLLISILSSRSRSFIQAFWDRRFSFGRPRAF